MLFNCLIYADCLDQSHAEFFVVDSDFVSRYEPWLVNSAGFLIMSLIPLTPKILPPSFQQDSPSSVQYLVLALCICFHLFLDEKSLMTTRLAPFYEYRRIHLGIIKLILFSPVVFDPTLGLWAIRPLHCEIPGRFRGGLILVEWVSGCTSQSLVGHFYNLLSTQTPAHLIDKIDFR